MSLDQYKCELCKILPDSDIFNCKNNHIICEKCVNDNRDEDDEEQGKEKLICGQCSEPLQKKQNPLLLKIQNTLEACKYQHLGCTWKFAVATMQEHLQECKYRPYYCIGKYLGIWDCSWIGIQLDFEEHISREHLNYPSFTHYQHASVPFNDSVTTKSMNLIDAFNRKFIFFYHAELSKEIVYFLIYLIGRKDDAEKYFIDFEIIHPENEFRKIKFFTDCFSDTEDILNILENEKCIALSYNIIKTHLHNQEINFRFVITKRDELKQKRGDQSADTVDGGPNKDANNKKSTIPFNFKDKGSIKSNKSRSSTSVPASSTANTSINKKTTGNHLANAVATKNIIQSAAKISQQQQTSNSSHQSQLSNSSQQQQQQQLVSHGIQPSSISNSDCIDRISSINSESAPYYGYATSPESPCYSPSIHRDGFFEDQVKQKVTIKRNTFNQTGLKPPNNNNNNNSNNSNLMAGGSSQYLNKYQNTSSSQPYRGMDNNLLKQSTIQSCLSRPDYR